jgi:hypothetical protein
MGGWTSPPAGTDGIALNYLDYKSTDSTPGGYPHYWLSAGYFNKERHIEIRKYPTGTDPYYVYIDGVQVLNFGGQFGTPSYWGSRIRGNETLTVGPSYYSYPSTTPNFIIDEVRVQAGDRYFAAPYTVPYTKITNNYFDWYSNFSTSTINTRIPFISANINAEFTDVTNGQRVRFSRANLTSAFSQVINARKSVTLASNQQATAALAVPLISRTRTTGVIASSTSTMTINAVKIARTPIDLNAELTQVINNVRTRALTCNQTSAFSQVTNASKTTRTSSHLDAFVSTVEIINKIGTGFIHMDSPVTLVVQGVITADQPQYLHANTQLTANVISTQFARAAVQASATVTANVDKIKRVEVQTSARATLACNLTATRRTDSTLAVQAIQQTATYNSKITGGTASLTSQAQLVSNNQILRLASADLHVEAAMPLMFIGILSRAEAHLVCEGFQLTAGKVINIDLYYQIKIKPESRGLIVQEETREIMIKTETRVNKIKGLTS